MKHPCAPRPGLLAGSLLAMSGRMSSSLRSPEPANVIGRFCAIACGLALTWICAAVGLSILTTHSCAGGKVHNVHGRARNTVRGIDQALTMYLMDRKRCPATRDDLVADGYADARDFVDPWGTSVAFWCSEDLQTVRSAGPDQIFDTIDDVTNAR